MHLSKFAGMAATTLLSLALPSAHAATGTIQDVQHVVILMQENRSMDHYFGCMGGCGDSMIATPCL